MDFMPFDQERVREALAKDHHQRSDEERLIARWVTTLRQTAANADYEAEQDAEDDSGEV